MDKKENTHVCVCVCMRVCARVHVCKPTYCELSKSLDNIADNTGRSAMTAVVITAFGLSDACLAAFRLPPDDGFRPKIHTRCWKMYNRYICSKITQHSEHMKLAISDTPFSAFQIIVHSFNKLLWWKRRPRSSKQIMFQVPVSKLKTHGDGSFTVVGPKQWVILNHC